jgi:hypothetical protein
VAISLTAPNWTMYSAMYSMFKPPGWTKA